MTHKISAYAVTALFLFTTAPVAMASDQMRVQRAFRCDPEAQLCVWTDGSDELHALAAKDEFEATVRMNFSSEDRLFSPELDARIAKLRKAYKGIHQKIRKSWSIPANLIVSDTVHADLATLSAAAYQVTTGWTNAINARLTRDDNASRDQMMTVLFPVASILSFNALPIGAATIGVFAQNVVFQLLVRYAVPNFLSSSGYVWTDVPSAMSASIHDIQTGALRAEISSLAQSLLTQIALDYLMLPKGQQQLEQDSLDQEAQYKRLSGLAGSPLSLKQALQNFGASRDFRLTYAAKIAPIVGSQYSEALNNFIVTGYFGELDWVSSGASARGTIFDLYVRPNEPAYETANGIGIPMDNRYKRTWSINWRGQLVAKDRGRFMEGRIFSRVHLILPYWDEPVKPSDDAEPILKGSVIPGSSIEQIGSASSFEPRDTSNFTPPAHGPGH